MEVDDARECARSPVQYGSLLDIAFGFIDDICVRTVGVVEPGSIQKAYQLPANVKFVRSDTSCS